MLQFFKPNFQNISIQEYERIKRLVLGRSGHITMRGQVVQVFRYFGGSHVQRMLQTMKKDESFDPSEVQSLG